MPESIKDLLKEFQDDDPDVQWQAVRAMREMGDEAVPAIPTLLDALRNAQPEFREYLCEALSDFERIPPRTIPALVNLLDMESQDVRDLVLRAVTMDGVDKTKAAKLLASLLCSGPPHVRAQAAFILGAMETRSRTAIAALKTASSDGDTAVASAAADALKRVQTSQPRLRFNWPQLYDGTLAPSTDEISFIEAGLDDTAVVFAKWSDQLEGTGYGRTVYMNTVEDFATVSYERANHGFSAPLPEAFKRAETVSAMCDIYKERWIEVYLFVETKSRWTAVFECLGTGSQRPFADLSGFNRNLAAKQGYADST